MNQLLFDSWNEVVCMFGFGIIFLLFGFGIIFLWAVKICFCFLRSFLCSLLLIWLRRTGMKRERRNL